MSEIMKKQRFKKSFIREVLLMVDGSLKIRCKNVSMHFPTILFVVSVSLISDSAFGSAFDLTARPDIFPKLVKWIDDNLAIGALISSTGGAVISSGGDLRTRAQGAGIGFITAMIVWLISKAFIRV